MAIAYVVSTNGTVQSFRNTAAAAAVASHLGEDSHFVATDKDLSKIPMPVLVTLFNTVRPEKPVKRFADRQSAEKRLNGVLEVLAKPGTVPDGVTVSKSAGGAKKTGGRVAEEISEATVRRVIKMREDKKDWSDIVKALDVPRSFILRVRPLMKKLQPGSVAKMGPR